MIDVEGYVGSQMFGGAYVDGHGYHQRRLANERPGLGKHSVNFAGLVEIRHRYRQGHSNQAHSAALDSGGTCEAGHVGDHGTLGVVDCDTLRASAGEELPPSPSFLGIHPFRSV